LVKIKWIFILLEILKIVYISALSHAHSLASREFIELLNGNTATAFTFRRVTLVGDDAHIIPKTQAIGKITRGDVV